MTKTSPRRVRRRTRGAVAALVGIALVATPLVLPRPDAKPPKPPRSRPDLKPPTLKATGRASGDVLLAPKTRKGQSGPMILDPTGKLVWFHPLAARMLADDFKIQRYRGKRVLTWWEGRTNGAGYGRGSWVIADSSYREIARVRAGDGLSGDLHDMQLTDHGTALLTIYHVVKADLRPIGSAKNGQAVDSIVQEVNVPSGRVLFRWHSLDHVKITDSYAGPPAPGHHFPYDYFHVNSVDVDRDGNLLISARNTWTVYKVNRKTGRVMWRLGGKRNDFTFGKDAKFAWQHDVRRQPDGSLTIFDNESSPKEADASRLLTLRLDEAHHRARLQRALTHPLNIVSDAEGDFQPLPGGGSFAGWGIVGRASEFGANGKLRFDVKLQTGWDSYRAFTFAWHGTPTTKPALTVERDGDDVTAYASWNGATDVTRWQLLAGDSPSALRVVATAPRTGFETTLRAHTDAAYMAVRALAGSRVLATSAAER